MSKKIFVLLLSLMSISLAGIIFIQSYFIVKNYQENDKQFSSNIKYALTETVSEIEKIEFKRYVSKFSELIASGSSIDTTSINNLYVINEIPEKRETIIYKNGIIEENIIIPNISSKSDYYSLITESKNIEIKRLSNEREEKIFSNNDIENSNLNPGDFLMRLGRISKSKEILFETAYNDLAKRNPIEARIGNINDFKKLLTQNLKDLEIKIDYEYAVYNGDEITGISSLNFEKNDQTFSSLIFKDENDLSNYSLKINFPSRTPFLISTLLPVIATSVVFTLIIIIAYITTILLLLRQRQISQIKSDFINNMTHEFKTPIATIDLALSAIKNPKTIVDEKKVKKYLKMINDENNRMHDQVENVLMMSQLERKEIYLDKKDHDINDLINLAISHVNLIIQNKKGKINFEKDLKLPLVRVNDTHMINVFVNILDNAIKYNENQPEIIIKSRILENKLIIDITDNGIGMSKSTRSKIFDKFYRPQTGDLHNVKGHGLGLSYVKKIIDLHNGSINVSSILGKGSTFTIQLNLH